FLFSVPMLWDKADTYKMLTRDAAPIVTDLAANLAHYRGRYAKTLANQRSLDQEVGLLNIGDDEDEFRVFYGRFYEQIADELRRTDARLTEHHRLAS
ncbi:MAG: hypothetical protein M3T56_06595, partial [Chloroflexota bacterium]|nr:hypothetical protein [Chloroflexota bacterium]